MKATLCIIFHLFIFSILYSQDNFYNYSGALADSKANNKNILLIFGGSDWCKPCIQLEKKILDSELFIDSRHHFIYLYLDFPYKKENRLSENQTKHNESLAEKFNSEGSFPKIVLIDSDETIIKEIKYSEALSAQSFIEQIKSQQP